MKNFKKLFLFVLLSGTMIFGLQSCSQYDDNEGITLVSKADRLSQAWKVENYKVNDVDLTSLMSGYTETYTKQGSFSYQWAILGGTATWAFQNNFAEIQITNVANVTDRTLTILRLEEASFWYYYMDGDAKKEFHMVIQ